MGNAERGRRKWECGMGKAEVGMRNGEVRRRNLGYGNLTEENVESE